MKLRLPLILAALLMSAMTSPVSFAVEYSWTGASSTNVSEGANWKDQAAGTVDFWNETSVNTMLLGADGTTNQGLKATGNMGLGGITVNAGSYTLSATDAATQSLFLNAAPGGKVLMDINENFTLSNFKAINVNADVSVDIAAGKWFNTSSLTGGAGRTISVVGNKATASVSPVNTDKIQLGTNAGLTANWSFSGGVSVDLWSTTAGTSFDKLGTGTITVDKAGILFSQTSNETIGNDFIIKSGGLVIDNGSSSSTKTFSGKFSGNGAFTKGGTPTMALVFTGDWSGFEGEFSNSRGVTTFDTSRVSMNRLTANANVVFKQGRLSLNDLVGNGLKIGAVGTAAAVTLNMGATDWNSAANIEILGTGTLTVESSAMHTLSGIISGTTGALNKTGNGTLVLTGNNTYGGLTQISSGTLELRYSAGGNSALLNAASVLSLNGGTLSLNANGQAAVVQTFASTSLSGNSSVDLKGTGLTVNFGAVTGTGKVLFTGVTGNTINALGTVLAPSQFLAYDGTNVLVGSAIDGVTGLLTFTDAGYISLPSSGSDPAGKYFLDGSGTVTESETAAELLLMGKEGDANQLTISDGKTLTVAGSLSYIGSLDYSITGGSLSVGTLEKGGGGNLTVYSSLTATNISLSGGSLTIDTTNSGDQTLAAVLSGNGTLVKAGAGTLTLSGASAGYTGGIRVEEGRLSASIANNAATVDSLGSGSLYIGEQGTITIGDSSHKFGQAGGQGTSNTFSRNVTGKGTLEMYLAHTENGTQYCVNTGNDFEGTLAIKSGMLAMSPGNGDDFATNVGKGTISFDAGTSMWVRNQASKTFAGNINIGGGEVQFRIYGNANATFSGKFTGTAASIIKHVDGGKLTYTGDWSGFGGTYNMDNGQVAFNTGGMVHLNTLTATGAVFLESGTLVLDSGFTGAGLRAGKMNGANTDGTNAPVTLSGTQDWTASGTFKIRGASQLIIDTRKYDAAAGAYTQDGLTLTLGGVISQEEGTGGTLKKTGAGTLVLTADNTYVGLTTVSGGTLQIGNGAAAGSVAGEIAVDAGAFVTFNRTGATTLANKLGGAGTAQFMGDGTSVYSLTNTGNAIGEFLLTGGTLNVADAGTLGAGKVTIQGGTLQLADNVEYNTASIVLDAGAGNAKLSSTATGSGAVIRAAITGTGNLEKTGAGLLILDNGTASTGQNFTGSMIVSAGTLQLGRPTGGTTGRSITYGTGDITVKSGARLALSFAESQYVSNTLTNKVILENNSTLYLDNGNMALNGLKAGAASADSVTLLYKYNHDLTLNAALEGAGTINLSESGENTLYSLGGSGLTLTQDSTGFSGKIVVDAPSAANTTGKRYGMYLQLNTAKAASGADIELKAASEATGGRIEGTQLLVNADNAEIGGLTGEANTRVLSGATKNTGDNIARNLILNGTGTFLGSLDSHLTLTKRGAGTTQTLGGGVLTAGTQMTVESGTLALGTGTDSLTTGVLASSYDVKAGGILLVNSGTANVNASTVSGTITLNGGGLQFGANLDGNCFAQKLVFAANGSSVTGGSSNASHRGWVLSYGASDSAQAANIAVNLGITGSQIDAGKIYFSNTNEAGAAVFNIAAGASLAMGSVIAGPDANAALKIQGGGTLLFTGSNGSNQTAVKAIVENGTLQIGNGGTAGSWGNGAIQLGATGAADGSGVTLVFNRSDAMTQGGIISGKGTVNFEGGANSIYTLQGVNTFTGTVNINAGKVIADSSQTFGVGNTVNLKTGAAVDFSRAQADATSVLNAAASTTIEHGSNFNGKLNILANTAGTAVNVTGGLNISELNFADGSTLNVTGAVTGGKASLDQNASLAITGGNLNLTSLEIKSATSHVNVGGNVSITNGGYLYLNLPTATAPLVTATGSVNLGGTFLLGFNSNELTEVQGYDFKLFQGSSYSNISAKLDFQTQAERSFFYLDTSKFPTEGVVTVVKTDWGYNLVNAADIAGMGGNYTPANGKELLGSKSEVNGGGTRLNPLVFNTGYTPVANDENVTAYRLTDGEGWMDFQTKMTGDGVGLVIQGDLGFTGEAADHGLIISNLANDYTGGTSILNAHVVLDGRDHPDSYITAGLITLLGTGDVTVIGNLAELELRPGGDYAGNYVFSNNLTLKDGAVLSQTGGSTTLTDGSLTLLGSDGGILRNATDKEFIIKEQVSGTKLTLEGNSAQDGSLIRMLDTSDQNVVDELVLNDRISFILDGGKLSAGTVALTSGNIDLKNGGALLLGGFTGAAGSTLSLEGGHLGTVETGSGAAIIMGGADRPAVVVNGTDNTITVGNQDGLEIRDLTGAGSFNLKGGHLTLSGGTADSHFMGTASVDKNSLLTVAQNAWLGGSITTAALEAQAISVQIMGGVSDAQRTTVGNLTLTAHNVAALDGDHITLGDILLQDSSGLGSTMDRAASDVTASSLTIETDGTALLGDDLHITGNASIADGTLQAGDNALIDGALSVNGGTVTLTGDAEIKGAATLGNGTLQAVNSLRLGSLSITGTGSVLTDTTDPASSIAIDGNALVGNGVVRTGVLSVGGLAVLSDGSMGAVNSIHLGSLEITGKGSVLTDTSDLTHSIAIDGDALIGNGSLKTGALSIGGDTVLNNGSLMALGDGSLLGGGLTITGAEGKADFKNNIAIEGPVNIIGGSLTAGGDSILGSLTLDGGKATLGAQASVGSLNISNGGTFSSGDGSGIAAGAGESISIGSGSTVTFGKNTTLGSAGNAIDISSGAAVNFGAGTRIEGNLGDKGLTFASGSSYSGFLDAGVNNVNFESGSSYLLDGPVLQQYTKDTIGLQSTGAISIDNGTRFILGENLGNYSILESPDTMTLIQATGGGKLLVGGEQVRENGNYGYLLENADKYFEWLTFNLIGGSDSLNLEMLRFVRFESVATTANEKAMAPVANTLATGTAFYDGELKKLGSALALSAKGAGHTNLSHLALSNASLLSGYMAQTQEVRRHNFDILTRASQEKTGAERLSYEEYNNTIWANGTGGTYTMRGDSNAAGYRTNQWGGILGASHGFSEHFVGGVAFSYTHSDTTVDGHYGSAKGDSYDIDLFGKYNRNNWNIVGAVTGGMTSLDTVRHLEIGDYSSRTKASGDGSHILATVQAGYQFTVSDDLDSILEPFALISGGYSSIDGLSEQGAGNAGLTTESRNQSLCTVGAGVRFTREYFTNADEAMRGRFEIRTMILQDLTDVNGDVTARYQGMNDRFRLEGASSSRLGVVVGAGIVQPLTRQTSIFGDVDGEFRSGENGVRANVGVKYSF